MDLDESSATALSEILRSEGGRTILQLCVCIDKKFLSMTPEQVRRLSATIDGLADMFGMGAADLVDAIMAKRSEMRGLIANKDDDGD